MALASTRVKATKVTVSPSTPVAAIDMHLGARDGVGFRRVDVEVRPLADGGARVEIEVPTSLARPPMQLVAALGVKPSRARYDHPHPRRRSRPRRRGSPCSSPSSTRLGESRAAFSLHLAVRDVGLRDDHLAVRVVPICGQQIADGNL
jgi:hypothetical protein